jgi:hypothetical protein
MNPAPTTDTRCDDFPMGFGKHKELTARQIAATDPDWIVWAVKNVTRPTHLPICSEPLFHECIVSEQEIKTSVERRRARSIAEGEEHRKALNAKPKVGYWKHIARLQDDTPIFELIGG